MKFYMNLRPKSLSEIPDTVRWLESLGVDGVSFQETTIPPTTAAGVAAVSSSRVRLMTGILVAFPRSPTVTAYDAWAIQQASKGRFQLGLGTQTKGHLQRRWATPWYPPARRMREYLGALRAIFSCWQNRTRLEFRGEYYNLSLMIPAFDPGPIDHPSIPLYTAGIGRHACQVAGELCDGIIGADPVTDKYYQEVVLPNLEAGARRSGRSLKDLDTSDSGFVGCGATEADLHTVRERLRERIAFYASTPTYKPVLDLHGWEHLLEPLHRMSLQGQWKEMAQLISDEMLERYTVVGTPEDLPAKLKRRLDGHVRRVHAYPHYLEGLSDSQLAQLVKGIQAL